MSHLVVAIRSWTFILGCFLESVPIFQVVPLSLSLAQTMFASVQDLTSGVVFLAVAFYIDLLFHLFWRILLYLAFSVALLYFEALAKCPMTLVDSSVLPMSLPQLVGTQDVVLGD